MTRKREGGARQPSACHRPLALAAASLLALASAWTARGAEIPRDTVVMAKQIEDIVSLDPAEAYEASDGEAVGNLYDRLLDYDPAQGGALRGALALSWNVEEDGRTFTFKLRPGLRFASGNPVTAEDAAFSLQRVVLLDKTPAFILEQFGFTKENVRERIRADGPDTLLLETATAVAPSFLYYCLTAVVGSVVDGREVRAHEHDGDLGHDWLAFHSAGSGPYRLRVWRPVERYALDANDDYWGGTPRNRRVVVLNVREPMTQRLLLEHGDADYARDLDRDQLEGLAGNAEIGFDRGVQSTLVYLALNQRNPNLRRAEVVEALKYLVDYEGIARGILGGLGVVHQSIVPTGLMGAIADTPYRFDLERARRELERAGLANGFALGIDVRNATPWIDIAQALQASFAQAGVRLAITPGDGKQTLTKYRARHHDLFLGEWTPDYPDPHSNAQAFTVNEDNADEARTKTLAWRNAWQDPALDALVRQALMEPSAPRRAELYQALQRQSRQIAPFVVMFQKVEVAARRRNVEGLVIGATPDLTRYAGITKR